MSFFLAAQLAPGQAPAAPAAAPILYTLEDFAAANPRTALDLVTRVPGFQLDEGDNARGFGGVAGNVLIDGERPSTKSESLSSILLRIPASGVERLELIRGAAAGLDVAGQAVVLNVVRKPRPFEGVVNFETRFLDDTIRPNGSLAATVRRGGKVLDGRIQVFEAVETFNAIEDRFTPAGALFEREVERLREPFRSIELQAGVRERLSGGAAYGLRFTGELGRFRQDVDISVLDGGLALQELQRSQFLERFQSGELSFDYEGPLDDGQSFKLVALQSLAAVTTANDFTESLGTPAAALSRFATEDLAGESVVRGTFSLRPAERLSLETGLEGAYNFLESDALLFEQGADGALAPVPLPSSDVRIAEGRGEVFANANYAFSNKLRLEAGLRVEASTIRQSGSEDLTRFFVFPRPRALLTWNPAAKTQLRFRAEREVGQLDFGDFVTSTSLQDQLINAGNPELEPDRAWRFDVAWEQRWGEQGSATLTLGYDDLQAQPDLVPVLGLFDAPGNLAGARRFRAELEANVPLDFLGLKGAVLETEAFVRDDRVADPLTGQDRFFSDERLFNIRTEYRHDLAGVKSTFNVNVNWFGPRTSFRLEELQERDNSLSLQVAYEYNGLENTSLRFQVSNVLNETFRRDRLIFAGPRNTAPLQQIDIRESRGGPVGSVRLRRVF